MSSRLYYLTLWLFLFNYSYSNAQVLSPQLEKILDIVRQEYDGERAYETTAYVSELWRVPGNAGFDSSIYRVAQILEKAGYQNADGHEKPQFHYRIERYPMRRPAWEPVDATVLLPNQDKPLLQFSTNRNMIAINSFSTPPDGLEAEVVYLENCDPNTAKNLDLKGKFVMADCHPFPLYKLAVEKHGAVGILSYRIPDYNQPELYRNNIPFRSIPFNNEHKAWAICLSYAARTALISALEKGPLKFRVQVATKFYPAEELTLIAEINGKHQSEKRFVFSAHVQEPGANDNASGVGALAEMARVAAKLVGEGTLSPDRTITFLWGDEISSTRRYIQQDSLRASGIHWGMSLDMVGEDTEKTGGTFLIEKMPDPSAIWTRGEDKHTEWGATPVKEKDFNPHYLNDFIEYVCRRQAAASNWIVNTNPFEGGSDHQPFLDANIPGLLLWHFTDVFYHTDADRIDKVSTQTLANVGISALSSALMLCNSSETTAAEVLDITQRAALKRIETEGKLSADLLREGGHLTEEEKILKAWEIWYVKALAKTEDILMQQASKKLDRQIKKAIQNVRKSTSNEIKKWKN